MHVFKYHLFFTLLFSIGICTATFGVSNYTIEPPFWYKGLKNESLMLLIQGKNVGKATVDIVGNVAKLKSIKTLSSNNYLAVFLQINSNTADTAFTILINNKVKIEYVVKKALSFNAAKLTAADNMYLITPDRFANGNPENDDVKGLIDKTNRQVLKGRHGGDLQGIINHVDYLKDLGITSLWVNPLIENNQKVASYHGYAATNFYAIDARFGSLSDYQKLSTKCSTSGIGLIMDVVYNHIGSEHVWMQDLPDGSWINLHDTFTNSNYRAVALSDPYATDFDKAKLLEGWFVPTMPDLNLRNQELLTYLIQNTLWWIQTAQLSGLRIDTYAYPDNKAMQVLVSAVKDQFPGCFVFGEIWEIGDASQAYYSPHTIKDIPQQGLDGITDYQLYFATHKWLQEAEGWSEGLGRIYYALSADLLYKQPENLVTFLDNHDQDRFFGKIKGDFGKWKQGIVFMLTTRGIPCIYYGTELLFNETGDHGLLRKDFPGGWADDVNNAFLKEGRTTAENEAFDYLQKLLLYRKNNPSVFTGSLKHFVPTDGIYVYFRSDGVKNLMVVISNSKSDQPLNLSKYKEALPPTTIIKDVFSSVELPASKALWVPAGSVFVGEF